METKQCNLCKTSFPATRDHFYRRAASSDGLSYTCRACTLARSNAYFSTHHASTTPKPVAHDGFRICSVCKRELILSNFYRFFRNDRPGKVYYSSQCKECSSIYHKRKYSYPRASQYKALAKQMTEEDLKTSDNPYARIPASSLPASSVETPSRGRPRSSKTCEPIYKEAQQRFEESKTVVAPEIPRFY